MDYQTELLIEELENERFAHSILNPLYESTMTDAEYQIYMDCDAQIHEITTDLASVLTAYEVECLIAEAIEHRDYLLTDDIY